MRLEPRIIGLVHEEKLSHGQETRRQIASNQTQASKQATVQTRLKIGEGSLLGLDLPPLSQGLHKSLMHNKRIRVTAGKYQGKCVKLWRVVGAADNLGTLAEIV
nr:hypothetical protein CFP56_05234 [Quercus suber]